MDWQFSNHQIRPKKRRRTYGLKYLFLVASCFGLLIGVFGIFKTFFQNPNFPLQASMMRIQTPANKPYLCGVNVCNELFDWLGKSVPSHPEKRMRKIGELVFFEDAKQVVIPVHVDEIEQDPVYAYIHLGGKVRRSNYVDLLTLIEEPNCVEFPSKTQILRYEDRNREGIIDSNGNRGHAPFEQQALISNIFCENVLQIDAKKHCRKCRFVAAKLLESI